MRSHVQRSGGKAAGEGPEASTFNMESQFEDKGTHYKDITQVVRSRLLFTLISLN